MKFDPMKICRGLLLLVLFLAQAPGGNAQAGGVWGTRPLLSYFVLTASLEEPLRTGAGLSPADFSTVQRIAERERDALRSLFQRSEQITHNGELSVEQKRRQIQALGYNQQVEQIVYRSDRELRELLRAAVYFRLVRWIEMRWIREKALHGIGSTEGFFSPGFTRTYEIFATRYESKGGAFVVALPDQCLKFSNGGLKTCADKGYQPGAGYSVAIRYKDSAGVLVGEAGPWNIDDNFWASGSDPQPRRMFADLPLGMPEAQAAYFDGYNGGKDQYGRTVTAPFAIDLAFEVADKIGLPPKKNDWITVSFLWTADWSGKPAKPGNQNQDTAQPEGPPGGGTAAAPANGSGIETATPAADGSIVHTVRAGETLWTVALAYGVSVPQIQFLNNMGATIIIYEGQRLKIKEAGPTWTPLPGSENPTERPQGDEQSTVTASPGTRQTTPSPSRQITRTAAQVAPPTRTPASLSAVDPTASPQTDREPRFQISENGLLFGALGIAAVGLLLFLFGWIFNRRGGNEEKEQDGS